jgi:AcrR family transcriptional regulator
MTRNGVDAVLLGDVATAGGVSRQFVYKFFPSRQALIKGVLEDFADALTHEFGRRAMHGLPASLEEATHVFIEAVCDTIEAKGAGPWHLLDSKGPDPELGRLGQEIMHRLVVPWHSRIARATGIGPREATIVARMLVAAGRAVLDLWCAGEVSRDEAVRYAARGVSALLETFPTRTAAVRVAPRPRRRASRAPRRRG